MLTTGSVNLHGRNPNQDTRSQPQGLDPKHVDKLLSQAKHLSSITDRIEFFSQEFLECSYRLNPLGGSPDSPEIFSVDLEGFDCVTYIESVLALALSSNVDSFVKCLRHIRYERGRVEWRARNHYMTTWIRNNERADILGSVRIRAVPTIIRERLLNVVPGVPARCVTVKSVPKRSLRSLQPFLANGDLIFFGSTRKNLDVFHTGILIHADATTMLRHASRSQGGVVEQTLSSFLNANRMAGVIIARPHESGNGE